MAYFDLSKLKFKPGFLNLGCWNQFQGVQGRSYMCRSKVKGIHLDKLVFSLSW